MTIKIAKKIVKYNVQKPDDKPAQVKPTLVVDPDEFQGFAIAPLLKAHDPQQVARREAARREFVDSWRRTDWRRTQFFGGD